MRFVHVRVVLNNHIFLPLSSFLPLPFSLFLSLSSFLALFPSSFLSSFIPSLPLFILRLPFPVFFPPAARAPNRACSYVTLIFGISQKAVRWFCPVALVGASFPRTRLAGDSPRRCRWGGRRRRSRRKYGSGSSHGASRKSRHRQRKSPLRDGSRWEIIPGCRLSPLRVFFFPFIAF